MTSNTRSAVAAVLGIFLSSAATANPPASSSSGSDLGEFYSLDRNGDGVLESKETAANPDILNNFSRLDRNTDGTLNEAEFSRLELDGQKALTPHEQSSQ
jgi:hypothetical protein